MRVLMTSKGTVAAVATAPEARPPTSRADGVERKKDRQRSGATESVCVCACSCVEGKRGTRQLKEKESATTEAYEQGNVLARIAQDQCAGGLDELVAHKVHR